MAPLSRLSRRHVWQWHLDWHRYGISSLEKNDDIKNAKHFIIKTIGLQLVMIYSFIKHQTLMAPGAVHKIQNTYMLLSSINFQPKPFNITSNGKTVMTTCLSSHYSMILSKLPAFPQIHDWYYAHLYVHELGQSLVLVMGRRLFATYTINDFLSFGSLANKIQWNWNKDITNFLYVNAFEISSAECRPFCWGLDMLTHLPLVQHICVSEEGQHWFT